tara:strand:+ start:4979 stop:5494 length:516 start_codon:yes stop_codon:yes gene_type:complete
MMKFNIKDLNKKQLVEKSNKESDAIYSKESTRKGRTIEAIRMSNLYGLASEQFLIEKCGFNDDPRAYKDVISPQGHSVEIKTTSAKGVAKMLNTCDYWKVSEPWRQLPAWLMIFESEWLSGEYKLQGTYEWNGQSYADAAFDWQQEAKTAINLHEDELWLANPVWNISHNA